MKPILKVLAVLLGIQAAVGLGLYYYGASLPETHREVLTVQVPRPAEEVWVTLTDYASMPLWWSDVASVSIERLPSGQDLTWNVDSRGQRVGFTTKSAHRPKKLVREIYQDPAHPQPWGGTWTFELETLGPKATRLTVTEDGYVKPPVFRAMAKLVFGTRKTLESFEKALKAKLS